MARELGTRRYRRRRRVTQQITAAHKLIAVPGSGTAMTPSEEANDLFSFHWTKSCPSAKPSPLKSPPSHSSVSVNLPSFHMIKIRPIDKAVQIRVAAQIGAAHVQRARFHQPRRHVVVANHIVAGKVVLLVIMRNGDA